MIQTPRDFFTALFVGVVALTAFIVGIAATTMVGYTAASLCDSFLAETISATLQLWLDRIAFILFFVVGFYFSLTLALRIYKRLGRELQA